MIDKSTWQEIKPFFKLVTVCPNCQKVLPKGRKVYCSNFCQMNYYNKKYRPVLRVDKWGREYLDCYKCGKRLRKLEYIGRTKFICINCHKAGNHKPSDNSNFLKKKFIKKRKTQEVILEITQNNRNWHYLNGRPIQGFKKAIKSFRAVCHTIIHREGYKEKI